jgi:hypothetical protein
MMTPTIAKENMVKYTPEDFDRMTRLCEEVEGRLYEMAMIMARTLAIKNPEFKNILKESTPPVIQYCKTWKGKDITKDGEERRVVICTPDMSHCGVHDPSCQCSWPIF